MECRKSLREEPVVACAVCCVQAVVARERNPTFFKDRERSQVSHQGKVRAKPQDVLEVMAFARLVDAERRHSCRESEVSDLLQGVVVFDAPVEIHDNAVDIEALEGSDLVWIADKDTDNRVRGAVGGRCTATSCAGLEFDARFVQESSAGLCARVQSLPFRALFVELFGGGKAELILTDPDNVLESGIEISVAPPGKVIKNLISLSGGEQSFVAIAIYFAILRLRPAPFCILDEIDAALDEVNVRKYAQYLKNFTDTTQFVLVTHRRSAMEEANVLYGVTMQEDGISKLLKMEQVDFQEDVADIQ